MRTELTLREATTSSVVELVPPSSIELIPQPPHIKPEFEKIALKLYRALDQSVGWYAITRMETHAPQAKWYPGSPAHQSSEQEAEIAAKRRYESLDGLGIPSSTEIQTAIEAFTEGLRKVPEEKQKHLEELRGLLRAAKRRESAIVVNRKIRRTLKRGKTLKYLRWLWFAVLTDRREKSDRVYAAHCKIYNDCPELYDERVLTVDLEDFREKIRRKSYKIGSPYDSAENWLQCGKTLFEEFGGDPIKLLEHAGWSVESVYRWKREEKKKRGYDPIPGWGKKLLSLYFLYLAELGYLMPIDAYPADIHAQALIIQTDMLEYEDNDVVYSNALAEMTRKYMTELCIRENLNPVTMAHASYFKGQLCQQCSSRPDARDLCVVYDECKGRVDTSHYFAKGRWPKDIQIMTKGGMRPEYDIPTNFDPRLRTAKRGPAIRALLPIDPLFPRQQKVIPIISLVVEEAQ
jgi:hypothetical protein